MKKNEMFSKQAIIDAILAKVNEIDNSKPDIILGMLTAIGVIKNLSYEEEGEPCEDAISRQAVLDVIEREHFKWNVRSEIEKLPLVNPQPKTGHWIEEIDDYGEVTCWHCDKCYEESGFTTDCKWDFCPNCGAEMVEP